MNFKQTISRYFQAVLQVGLIACVLSLTVQAAGEVDSAFNPALVEVKFNGVENTTVNRIAIQPDGKALVAGFFQAAGKFSRSGIVRLNTDGTVDTTFVPPVIFQNDSSFPRTGGNIFAVAVQADGKILIGGDFTNVAGTATPGVARLNSNGSLDASFGLRLSAGATFTGTVLDLKVAADGKITFGGGFTYNSGGTRFAVARVLADGSVDPSFTSPAGFTAATVVWRVELLSGDKTLISGVAANTNTDVGFIYRLNSDGSQDAAFAAATTSGSTQGSNAVTALRVQPDGKILAGGSFSLVNGFPVRRLVRFNADGSFDTGFDLTSTGPDGFVRDIELLPGGMILVGGNFSTYNGVSRSNVALLNTNGNLDGSLVYSGTPLQAKDIAVLTDGKILVGGEVRENGSSGGLLPSLIRLNTNGSLDTSFSLLLGNAGRSNKVFIQPDGKILIAGVFTHTDNRLIYNISRVNADGTFDATFTSLGFSLEILGIDVRADGKILIATSGGVLRLNANGTLDAGGGAGGASYDAKFLPGGGAVISSNLHLRKTLESGALVANFNVAANAAIRRILIQPDGKFVVAGDFTMIAGVTRGRIARINADGTLDTTFNPPGGASNSIFDAVLQPDGKIIVGGNFPGINFNTNYKYLARLNSDGSLDTTFNPIIEGGVQSLRLQPDGKILLGGGIYLVNGVARARIARLNSDGSLNASFNPAAGADNAILSIDLEANGSVIIGGSFTRFNNVDRLGVARLLNASAARTRFDFDGDGRADLGVFRPSNGGWYIYNLANNTNQSYAFGSSADKITPADYDGDGRTDVAVYRDGTWYLNRSQLGFTGVGFGTATDIPVPADFDGDGKAELAVFRPSNGGWYIYNLATNQTTSFVFGQAGDVPVAADYDGDSKADIAVFRDGTWYIQRSQLGFTGVTFGQASDKPVPADYDGDGKIDIAVFRDGNWYLNRSQLGFAGVAFGQAGDLPVAADYDGDGKADIAVFRDGTWYLQRSSAGFTGVTFGTAIDKPIPNAFVY